MAAVRFVRSVLKSFQAESGLEPSPDGPSRQEIILVSPALKIIIGNYSTFFICQTESSFPASSSDHHLRLFGENLRVTAADPGRVEFELDIKKEHTNRLNIIHGGTIASMVDLGGSLAVASRGLYATGVSTDLNVTYLNSGGQVGDVLKAVVTCDKFGKTLAYTSISFTNSKGDIAARGSHTKYVALAWKHPENIIDQLSPRTSKPDAKS
ncbi:Thioesterase/thiol ester dehydrase-isomerase [Glarea lozoyensis ATCC 20868]|uniref:Thioesterase/thiol ester dehydrase-isomerase n=1 Tax=Glarea lozoyensis (strain ATCC 20868 / MF5171) TaxID=1116229 RepID=S3DZ57_GLAL2|nr:Thioesterase/thiol ester dehydrase-isomerase [Glarea lozoyensis ATCC 20868]EPE31623.1 Thioesterase/thiol ester dehydrase-isomerase [Glarea lozoyensis ATCC 20868]